MTLRAPVVPVSRGPDPVWCQDRRILVRTLVQLSRPEPADAVTLARFSAAMVDYVSRGHLEVYPALLERSWAPDAADTYERLAETTERLLDFSEAQWRGAEADRDALSLVGMTLAEHFELEDALVRGAAATPAAA